MGLFAAEFPCVVGLGVFEQHVPFPEAECSRRPGQPQQQLIFRLVAAGGLPQHLDVKGKIALIVCGVLVHNGFQRSDHIHIFKFLHGLYLQFLCLFPWLRLLALLLFAASSCTRMDGFFGFAARNFLVFGAFSSALTAAAMSVREICSPAFALASNSPREGALFNTPSIIFSFCSVESSAVRSGFSRKTPAPAGSPHCRSSGRYFVRSGAAPPHPKQTTNVP